MGRRSILVLTFIFGLVGGGALATGWYSATAVTVESGTAPSTSTKAIVVGGAHSTGTTTGRAAPAGGRWIISESGAVMWITADQVPPAGATNPSAQWYAERARQFAEMARDLECQINGIGCTQVEDLNQGY